MLIPGQNVTPAPLPDQRQEDDPGFTGRIVSAISRFVKGRPEMAIMLFTQQAIQEKQLQMG